MTFKKAILLRELSLVLYHKQMKDAEEYRSREDLDDGCRTPHQFRDPGYIHRQGKHRKHKR